MSVIPTVEDTSTDYGPKVSQRFISSSYLSSYASSLHFTTVSKSVTRPVIHSFEACELVIMEPSISFLSILFSYHPLKGQPAVEAESVFGRNSSEANREICDKDHQLCGHKGAHEDEDTKP